MYIKDGIAYAGDTTPCLTVAAARYVGNQQIVVTFSTGEERLLDAFDLTPTEAFRPLEDESLFRSFRVERGVLTWMDGQIDIAPEGLYRRTYEYTSPERFPLAS